MVEGQILTHTRDLCTGMKCIASYGASDSTAVMSGIDPNATNQFFSRFDNQDFSATQKSSLVSVPA